MTIQEAIKILTTHNKWRRGEPPYDKIVGYHPKYSAKEVGIAIDVAIKTMQQHGTNKEG